MQPDADPHQHFAPEFSPEYDKNPVESTSGHSQASGFRKIVASQPMHALALLRDEALQSRRHDLRLARPAVVSQLLRELLNLHIRIRQTLRQVLT